MRTFINLGYLTKVNIDNLNSSENPGNMILLKKVQDSKGDYYVYVSGQALRYYLKETMNQLGMPLTKLDKSGEYIIKAESKDDDVRYKEILRNHPDLDLLGFMEARKGSGKMALRRWSPVKVSPMISVYPWKGETDMLTQKKEGQDGGELVKIEINTFNFMKGTIILDADMIGSKSDELSHDIENVLETDEKVKRINYLVESIKNLDGGAKKARLLDDLTPKFVVVTKQKAGTPIFLNALDVDSEGNIKLELLQEIFREFHGIIEDYCIGIRSGIFENEEQVKLEFGEKVISLNQALEKIKEWSD
ncbi:type I-B CRISPR-associated protein Cas7/Cst2/DevR [Methanobacterium sp. MZ-A1]|uniref:type I-B CRISPR-associated protein Cas7/Cst2/DevR n=1 Tax=Methanobacterium sp. MZ-A1 TaxID=1911685 RepID=UPI000C2D6159|nr:type I-B CRISPR-associated protein Cas7/Cst2/DevR [Methanobacterium sp. MZ-A1]AUB58571.1 type I-B CRISPR-associated protein Cas7/Cst2/DevR [Methanobacterium sp. MZ-A1]